MKFRSLVTLMSLLTFLGLVARAEPLKIGAAAPAVSGVTDEGKTLNLADVYKANDYTLVWFYPKALTGGCTKQGCSLRDAAADLKPGPRSPHPALFFPPPPPHTRRMIRLRLAAAWLRAFAFCFFVSLATAKPRARELGAPFEATPGTLNAITDVAGVEVGHTTL